MGRPKKKPPNRGDNRWEVKRTVAHTANGKPVMKSFYSRISYEDAVAKAEAYIKQNGETEHDITLGEWAQKWLETYKQPNVKVTTYASSYERPTRLYIKPYFDKRIIRHIRPVDIQEFFNSINHLSESTLDKIHVCINGIFETAIDNRYCDRNPCRNINITSVFEKSEKRVLTRQQADKLLSKCDKHPTGIYVRILLELGLRCSELCGLKWSDFDFANNTVTIREAVTGSDTASFVDKPKTASSKRVIPISQELSDKLQQIAPDEKDSYIIIGRANQKMTPAHFMDRRMVSFYKFVDWPEPLRLTPHELRHTCGTLLYEKTHDIYAVSKFLGHSGIEITTKYYVHSNVESLRAALDDEDDED